MNSNGDNSIPRKRGHAVLFPGQSPGLFGPFVQILYHLDSIRSGFTVTLVTPSRYFADLAELQKSGSLQSIDLRLEEIPGTIPVDENGALAPGDSLEQEAFRETEPVRRKLSAANGTPEAPTVVICDMLLSWCKSFADDLGIPCYPFYHCAPHFTLMMLECAKMLKARLHPQTATNGDELLPADSNVSPLLRIEDYPPELTESPEYSLSLVRTVITSAGILMNTAEALDASSGVLSAVKRLMGPSRVFCIGPSVQIPGFGLVYSGSSASTDTVLPWLNSQQEKSVLYVAFGSVAVVPNAWITELAAALESSGVPFLVVLRTEAEELSEILPPGFEQRTSGRGRIETGWVNQGKILQHPTVGGYLTHCGWNSTLEGICSGVPFIAWPVFVDQPLNARYLHHLAKVGISIAETKPQDQHTFDNITRREIELAIRKLMLEKEGQRLRTNVEELRSLVVAATTKGGSSYQDVLRFLDQISSCT